MALLFLLLAGRCTSGLSQQPAFTLTILLTDTIHTKEFNSIIGSTNYTKAIPDSLSARRELAQLIFKLQGNGYLSASIDSFTKEGSTFSASLYLGEEYQWALLSRGNADEAFLTGTGFRSRLYAGKPFRYDQVRKIQEGILSNCENNGYPFASIRLDSLHIKKSRFSASLHLEKNKLVKIDSITFHGKATIAPVFVYNYIGLKPGDLYNEIQISRISNRIRELPFLQESRPNRVVFTNQSTKVELSLENKKASQFDGVIGFLPDEQKSGKLNITGEVHLKLQNSLKHGEVIELNWKQFPGKSQDLKIHGLYPFLLNTPFGIDGNLALYKKDSTYVDVTRNLGIQYSFTGNNFLKAFVTSKESSLQSTKGLENITTLPPYADISSLSYGLTFHAEHVDYRLNPRKGFILEATASTGNRTIHKNADINPVLYDSLTLRSASYQAELKADYYFSPGGRHVLDFGTLSGYMHHAEIFINEMYRIGGLKSLRGFDEESIYASTFSIGKLEYRYLLEQNSFLFIFYNQAWYENKNRDVYLKDTPLGFGAGINFETKLGIMSVSYALGKQFGNPIYFRTGKIHFGIVNYF